MNKVRRSSAILVMFGFGAALLGACSGAGRAPRDLRIGVVYPTAGPQGGPGLEEQHGVELAAQWANSRHAVGARHIVLVEEPADRAEAVPSVFADLSRQGVGVVVGSHSSAISVIAAGEATRRHMLFWETGAVGDTEPVVRGGVNFMRLAPMGANLGRAAIAFIAEQVAPRLSVSRALRYAVARVDDVYGRAVARGALDEIRARRLVSAGEFSYSARSADWAGLAARIGAAHPDVLFASAYLDDAVALRRSLVDARVPLLASIGTSSSYCTAEFAERLGPAAVGLFASDKPDAAAVRPDTLTASARSALAWATSAYRARYEQEMSAPALAGFANASALFAYVLPSASSGRALDVARAALATKLAVGALPNGGGLDIAPPGSDDAGANRAAAAVIEEWVDARHMPVVWPPAYATHPIDIMPLAA